MAIFAVIGQPGANAELLPVQIEKLFPNDHLDLGNRVWLVAAKNTAQELSDKLGITNGKNGAGIVIGFSSYFGFASPNIWEWIKVKLEG